MKFKSLKKFAAFGMAAILAVSSLAACGEKSEEPTPDESGVVADDSTLVVALQQDIVSFDPAFAYEHTTNQVVDQVCESILQFDAEGGLQPMLAESWEAVDAQTYVYKIRSDVNFSDGNPMTMEDVLFSVKRHMDPDVASDLAWFFENVESIEQTGEWEMTVKLSAPDTGWQYALATCAGSVVEKAYYDANPDNFGGLGVGVIGTGVYVYESWTTGTEVKLSYNENYWNKEAGEPDYKNIDFRIFTDETNLVKSLQNGQVDFCLEPPVEVLSEIEAADNLKVDTLGGWACLHLEMNCSEGRPFADPNVRLAVAYALDKDALYEGILSDSGDIAINSMPFGEALYGAEAESWAAYAKDAFDPKGDMEKAKEYMAKSNYPDGFDCVLYVKNSSIRQSCAEYVQAAVKELGINVTVNSVDGSEMSSYQFGTSRDYDMIVVNWEADYPDPAANIYPLFYSKNAGEGGANGACYSNPKVDELLVKQASSTDLKERTQLLQDALDIIGQDCPFIPFFYATNRVCMSTGIDFSLSPSYIWNMYLKDVKKA